MDTRHMDALSLADSSPNGDPDADEVYCDTCEKKRDPKAWIYHCTECFFISHIECALEEKMASPYTDANEEKEDEKEENECENEESENEVEDDEGEDEFPLLDDNESDYIDTQISSAIFRLTEKINSLSNAE
ncbi:hypothetical protein HS088_TW17G00053 [Tripterygium wilfordii]|uniref:DC1 domain-containing protein n=2 Tax=Tripterygium wilfordii TaxID=458696 RepID=A0A7J7CFM9_TRIWF|nr:hypothetical protein HS088_TW17G00053 [Tripterygium wilfordii]